MTTIDNWTCRDNEDGTRTAVFALGAIAVCSVDGLYVSVGCPSIPLAVVRWLLADLPSVIGTMTVSGDGAVGIKL